MPIQIQQLETMRIHADPDPDTDLDPKPWGGGSTNLYLPRSLFLSLFPYIPLYYCLLSPSTLFLLPYISLLSSSSPSLSLSFLSKIIATFLRPFLLTFLLFSIYIPFFMIQTVTKQMLAITTCSPPLSPPSSSPYLLLISFLSNITDYHCIAMVAWTSPLPPITRGGGGGEKGLVSLSPT